MLDALLNRGLDLAPRSLVRNKHICFIVKKHVTVAVGMNDYGNSESIHAEEAALFDGLLNSKRYHGASLYVFRYKQDTFGAWTVENSQPCVDCVNLIRRAGIKKVYYSAKTEQGDRGVVIVKTRDLHSTYVSLGRRNQRQRLHSSHDKSPCQSTSNDSTTPVMNKK